MTTPTTTPFEDLFELLDKSDKLVVHDEESIVYTSTEKSDVESLKQALHECLEMPLFHSKGMAGQGNPRITLYHEAKEVLQISHHSSCKSIHCSLYSFDIPLSKPQVWLDWFDQKKITAPREEFDKLAARKREQREQYKAFLKAMPPYLASAWKRHEATIRFDGKCPEDLKKALRKNLCGKTLEEKIADVLIWYGTGGDKQQIYERAVEALLLDFAQDIENAIESQYDEEGTRLSSDPRLIMGSYKLAGSLRFKKKHPEGLHLEPLPVAMGVSF